MALKRCVVPSCKNTSENCPDKVFLTIPKNKARLQQWVHALNVVHITASRSFYCCEDHFNLQQDAQNWYYFKYFGRQLMLKPEVVPHLLIENTSESPDKRKRSQISPYSKRLKLENVSSQPSNSSVVRPLFTKSDISSLPSNRNIITAESTLLFENNSTDSELTFNLNEPVCIEVHVMEKQPETDFSAKEDINDHLNEYYSAETVSHDDTENNYSENDVLQFIKSEPDETILSDKELNNTEDKTAEQSEAKLTEILHEEIEIKEEIEEESANDTDIYTLNAYGISPNSQRRKMNHSEKTVRFNALKQHQIPHKGEKPFACNQCGYKCTRSIQLEMHQLSHSEGKSYRFNQWDYKCASSKQLKIHQMGHLRKKLFTCNKCDYEADDLAKLNRHQMIHSGEKPFACDQCDYKAAQSTKLKSARNNDLKRHEMKHSAENAFIYGEHNYATVYLRRLKQHRKRHKPYNKCEYTTSYKGAFKQHLKEHLTVKDDDGDSMIDKNVNTTQKVKLTCTKFIHIQLQDLCRVVQTSL